MKKVKSAAQASKIRVAKKLAPQCRGTLKLTERFGDSLVCVRHRVDDREQVRYTTVELLVEATPIHPRVVNVRNDFGDAPQRALALKAGAVWDSRARRWRMSRGLATKLGLLDHIIEK